MVIERKGENMEMDLRILGFLCSGWFENLVRAGQSDAWQSNSRMSRSRIKRPQDYDWEKEDKETSGGLLLADDDGSG